MYVCRSLQNGLPALRFAVIRGFWSFAFGMGSEPARVVSSLSCFCAIVTWLWRRMNALHGLFQFSSQPRT